jgi:AcrR family transcriptional regulator
MDDLAERIVDAALVMAESEGWDRVRLRRIAAELGIDMAEIAARFRDRDAIADAWFGRARAAMLAPPPADFAAAPAGERLFVLMMRFLDALAAHRRVTVAMLQVKLWPFHPHHWLPMLFELSRIVLWWRDAASLDAPPPRREIEEIGLTWLFLATLAVWANDATRGQERTRRFLRRCLDGASALAHCWCPPHVKPRSANNATH